MGALSRGSMGVAALFRLDVGFLRAVGLGSLPLWPLVALWRGLGVVAGTGGGVSRLLSGLAPAYVSFFGFGGGVGFGVGFGFGFGFGHVGWLPCGPGDWYHPWYGRYGGSYRAVSFNHGNNFHNGWAPLHGGGRGFSNVNAAFRNDHVRSGMSSMDSRSFGRGTVPAHQTGLSAGEFRNASMVSGKMPVNPGRGSYSATNRVASPTTIRNSTSSSQRFYSPSRNNNSGGSAQPSRGYGGTSNQRNNGGYSNSTRSAQPNINAGNRGGTS